MPASWARTQTTRPLPRSDCARGMPTISIESSSPTFKKNGSPDRRRPSALTSAIRHASLAPSAQRTLAVTSMGSRSWARRVFARFMMIAGRPTIGNSSQLPTRFRPSWVLTRPRARQGTSESATANSTKIHCPSRWGSSIGKKKRLRPSISWKCRATFADGPNWHLTRGTGSRAGFVLLASIMGPLEKERGNGLPPGPFPRFRTASSLQVHVVQVVRRLARRVVRVGRAVTSSREHARVARDAPLVDRRVGVDVALRGGHEARGRRSNHASGAAAGRRGVRLVEGAAVLERVHLDAGVGGLLGDDRVGAVLDVARGGEEVGIPVVALRLEAHFARQRGEAVLLLEERLLRREDGLEVRLRLALLRPRLELDEVRDRDRREDADDRNDDHQLDERKALLDKLLHWSAPFRKRWKEGEQATGQTKKSRRSRDVAVVVPGVERQDVSRGDRICQPTLEHLLARGTGTSWLGNLRRNGGRLAEHQPARLHAELEFPTQHFNAEAALSQGGPKGALRVNLRQGPGHLLNVLLYSLQDLRGDVGGGLAHHHLHGLPLC